MKVKSNAPTVSTGDTFWQIMDRILCIKESYPGEARKDAKELCKMWDKKKEEIEKLKKQTSNLKEAIDILEMREKYD